ncbi:MAG: hypothetical protein V3T90_16065 [Anaerolineae bacterium]
MLKAQLLLRPLALLLQSYAVQGESDVPGNLFEQEPLFLVCGEMGRDGDSQQAVDLSAVF